MPGQAADTSHTTIIMLVQAHNNSNNSPSDNSHANPDACAGSQKFKQLLTPVQALENSHANAYACAGSANSQNSLRLCRLPTIHKKILMLLKVPNNSNNSLRWCRLPTIHTQILPLVKAPNNSNNSIHD
ncbi:hypothetical protein O181_077613 [Austropuccinia psidii MF-1]|uniref:Uncharacterized protein n=1 Tax=Austropuccinia psidii MF-1 TaxID=1389203 RepID=A0A9Q3FHA2_9BASI|nr:hypothetical protein [Austropuccinia psidii MF-1]